MATGRVPTTANSPLTAKGDLFGYSTTQARVAVGNNGETLVADSSQTTGLRYTAGTVQANPVLNSAFQVWQRGTSVTGAGGGAYTADRWFLYAGGQATVSRQATGDTTNLPNIQYCARVQRNNASSDTTNIPFIQSFETINSVQYAGKTVTMSFYARKGANYSPTGSGLVATLATGTGTDQNYESAGYTGGATPISTTATLTTTWQRFTYTATLASNITELTTRFVIVPTGTAGAADYFEITGVQIDIGSVALPFRTYAATIQGELAACQRYYYRTTTGGSAAAPIVYAFAYSTTASQGFVPFPVTMRVNPSSTADFSLITTQDIATGSYFVPTGVVYNGLSPNGVQVLFTGMSGLTVYRQYAVYTTTSAGYLAFNGEL